MDPERYYVELAAAFVRGRLPALAAAGPDVEALVREGKAQGLSLHKFKRSATLPRVAKVLGILRGLMPGSLLDVGSGRGVFLWPLLHEMPWLSVTALDADPLRVRDLRAVHDGGIERLRALQGDAAALPVSDGVVDVATALEVLEHLTNPEDAAAELLRVASRFVVVSVPSGPDDNPQHIQLFTPDRLRDMFMDRGARRVQIEHVLGHMIAVIRVEEPAR
ncbi:class I SAM-dependent methyltransferase [Paraliomyxa miuraensis]|uniref:class I SAM-dependent methyltransferase n=1 Tax=Paraliomyxa miuraensis TaxID=376150 RepID=UPI00224D8E39|nr:class I SAM-dependent methyltransferase [Paraliomyxa miuraensis]MCX4240756.1 class I SAM-dependent methyltransferase [Paraliomyxa miuraensis]